MNNRIQELAEQASVTTITINGNEFIVDGCYIVSPSNLKKFAELIVKECLDCCYHVGRDSGPVSVDLIRIRIKNHFGVE